MNAALFRSHVSDEHPTPQAVFDTADERWGRFTLDAACTFSNAKCRRVLTALDDALSYPWSGRVWCNPPYSATAAFVTHAIQQVEHGNAELVAMLLPASTATVWWREAYEHADEVVLIGGKLKFGDAKNTAPLGSTLFVFRAKRPVWGSVGTAGPFEIPKRHGTRERWFTVKPSSKASS